MPRAPTFHARTLQRGRTRLSTCVKLTKSFVESTGGAMSKRRRVAAPSDSVLEINVGGTIFVTKKSTLSFENDSMLARLFDDESPFGELPRDQSDRVFLDRDPAVFGVVLEYLRCAGRLVGATARSADELSRVKEQAEFFGLSGLVSAVDEILEERQKAENARTKKATAEEAKRKRKEMAEAAEEVKRKTKEELEARRGRKIMQYRHARLGPLDMPDGAELDANRNELKELTLFGFRVHHMNLDKSGRYCELLLGRELVEFHAHDGDDDGDEYTWRSVAEITDPFGSDWGCDGIIDEYAGTNF